MSARRRRAAPGAPRASQGGFSLIEVTVAVSILAVALLGLVSAIALAVQRSTLAAEMAQAQDAARKKIEEIESQDFRDLNALYDPDPADDPGGAGTAPGSTFVVAGLTPRQGQTRCGQVILPPAGGTTPNYTFYESPPAGVANTTTADLGFPMDLNGDGDLNDTVLTNRVIRFPVKVRIEWRGASGDSEFEICAVVIRR